MPNIYRINISLGKLSWMYVLKTSDALAFSDNQQKNKKIKTVVNKLDSIDTTFRFFKMELIAGEPDYIVEHVSPL